MDQSKDPQSLKIKVIKDTTQLINGQGLVKRKERMESEPVNLSTLLNSKLLNKVGKGKKRKPFNWPMQNHVNFVNKYPALLKWGLLIKEGKELGHFLLKLQLNVCVKGLVKTKSPCFCQSVCHVCLSDLRSCLWGWRTGWRGSDQKCRRLQSKWRPLLRGFEPWTCSMVSEEMADWDRSNLAN